MILFYIWLLQTNFKCSWLELVKTNLRENHNTLDKNTTIGLKLFYLYCVSAFEYQNKVSLEKFLKIGHVLTEIRTLNYKKC
jgi:hypothetical protein